MNDYNVNIDLKDVFNNPECVISVGHSQLIKWIEELTGTENNYLEAERVRKEISALKKLDNSLANKIKIKNKYNELYDFQFEPNLISVQFDKKQHFDNCCHSLIVNGQHFRRLYGTPGGLKMSTVLFISNLIYDEVIECFTYYNDFIQEKKIDLKFIDESLYELVRIYLNSIVEEVDNV